MNPARTRRLNRGDHVIVPAVCWSTSVAPIIQLGCVPVYVDVSPDTANVDLDALSDILQRDNKIRAIMAVHVIGASCNMDRFMELVRQYDILLIEDTCESMGSTFDGKFLGTFGNFGTFSMYYSHHMTCGEGGIVTCHTQEDYNLLLCLRAHGWTRHLPNKEAVEHEYPHMDPRFLFINTGFNLRPMSLQAVCASEQLKKLPSFIEARKDSYQRLYENMKNIQAFRIIRTQTDAAWFGFAIVLRPAYWHQLNALKEHLTSLGIQHRPIISGNMARQPFNQLYDIDACPEDYYGAEIIHHGGLFIGLHSKRLSEVRVQLLSRALSKFNWYPERRVLVTGGSGMLGHALQERLDAENCFYISSKDCDLRDYDQTDKLFRRFHPTHIIHAAADVGGLYKNLHSNFDIGLNNQMMNTNVIKCALKYEIHNLIAISSTCIFPAEASEFNEHCVHNDAPHSSNADYAMSKRTMHLHVKRVREARGYNWRVLIPCNMYGPHDSFCPINGHVIGSLIGKAMTQDVLTVYGTGKALRQFMYVDDFARIIRDILRRSNIYADLICAPPDEHRISDVAQLIASNVGIELTYDTTKTDGQIRKYGKSINFNQLFPGFEWTSLDEGIQKTLDWYRMNY